MRSWNWMASFWSAPIIKANVVVFLNLSGALLLAALWWSLLLPAVAAEGNAAPSPPDWGLSPNGDQIVHRTSHQAWSRCLEGMQWSGQRCTGEALLLDHAEALARAKARGAADGVAWRLPQMKELEQLALQNTRLAAKGVTLLPPGDHGWCWTATTTVTTRSINKFSYANVQRGLTEQNLNRMHFLQGWAVDTATGEAQGDVLKRTRLLVRLVRRID